MMGLLRAFCYGALVVLVWLDWFDRTPINLVFVIVVTVWGARGFLRALEP